MRGEDVQAILLDALGTLVALEPPGPRLRLELGRLGVAVSEAQAAGAISAEIAYYRQHLDEGLDQDAVVALRERCAEVARAALPAESGAAALDPAAMTNALLASLRFTAFADVRPALEAWRRDGLRLVAVSNWDVSLKDVLERLELAPLLDGIVTSAQAGARKPSRAIFERALALAQVAAPAAIHVGDTIEEDVIGARAAGIR